MIDVTLEGTVAAVVAPLQTPFLESHFSRRTSKLDADDEPGTQDTAAVPSPLLLAATPLGAAGGGGGTSGVVVLTTFEYPDAPELLKARTR